MNAHAHKHMSAHGEVAVMLVAHIVTTQSTALSHTHSCVRAHTLVCTAVGYTFVTFVRTQVEEAVSQMLDDHIVMTQSMTFSPFKKPFEERLAKWEAQLSTVCRLFFFV